MQVQMKKLTTYLRPSIKVRALETMMLEFSNAMGNSQLGNGKGVTPTDVPHGTEESLPTKKNLWDE